jgi:hypothetical protein
MKTATQVAYRAASLSALLLRLNVEVADRADPTRGDQLARLRDWLETEDLERHLSGRERRVVAAGLGALEEPEIFELKWRLQALPPLLWAIGKLESMPPYFEPSSFALLRPAIPAFEALGPYLRCSLRPEAEIQRERDRAELWHWRMRTRLYFQDRDSAVILDAATAAQADGLIDATREGDLDCGGIAYGKLAHAKWADAASTAVERHWALNWICGDSEDWEAVPTDT